MQKPFFDFGFYDATLTRFFPYTAFGRQDISLAKYPTKRYFKIVDGVDKIIELDEFVTLCGEAFEFLNKTGRL